MRRSEDGDARLGQLLASGTSLLTLGAVLWPVVQNWRRQPRDGFPFSYYPMFSARRGGTSSVTCVIGIDADGNRHSLHYRHAGFGGHNQVRRQLRRMAIEGRAEDTCASVIANIARERPKLHRSLAAVQIVTRTYRLDDYFGGGSRDPLREKVHASVVVQAVPHTPCPPAVTLAGLIHEGPV